jgi:hypothetical protein
MFPAYLQISPYLQIYRSVSPDLQICIITRTATGKRKHGETLTPKWARGDMEIEVGNQKPDGVILDTEEKMIYIIEGIRCSDTGEAMETAEVTRSTN